MRKPSPSRRATVCLFSVHPLALPEMRRGLEEHGFRVVSRRIDPARGSDRQTIRMPRASVYVLDSQSRRGTTEGLAAGILASGPGARLVVMAEKLEEASAFPLLRLGAKGLLTYAEASRQLPRALEEVAKGGYWVPRSLLSRFVEANLAASPSRRLTISAANLTRREREVLDSLLENLSNKEIARKLQISERTAKFHVSNLLAKYAVKRRADLILLNLTR